jgi:hypothetical protein
MSVETPQSEKPSIWFVSQFSLDAISLLSRIPRVRDFPAERAQQLPFENAEEHPLKFGREKDDDEKVCS